VNKLNLGGRDTRIEGFTNVDLHDGENVDVRADAANLYMIPDATVEEIYASHILEHFPHPKTVAVLKEWRRVLKAGGKAYISVPDFDLIVRLYKDHGLAQFLVDLGWGGQEYAEAYHFAPFNYSRLAFLLNSAGFADVKRLKNMPYGLSDCSYKVDSFTGQPISVSVEATA
jgi:SAM-dependent methyltransferase